MQVKESLLHVKRMELSCYLYVWSFNVQKLRCSLGWRTRSTLFPSSFVVFVSISAMIKYNLETNTKKFVHMLLIIHKQNTKTNHAPYRFYIFDIDLRQISCLTFAVYTTPMSKISMIVSVWNHSP